MKKISIMKGGNITNQVELNDAEAEAWLSKHIAMGTFGAAAYSYEQETTPAVLANGDEILNGEGQSYDPPQYEQVLVTPTVMETINVPAEYEVQEEDTTAAVAAEEIKTSKIASGRASRQACENVLDLIAGFNLERELTPEQITTIQSTFGQIELALRSARPSSAKVLITAMVPDEVLVTAEMKAVCLELLANY